MSLVVRIPSMAASRHLDARLSAYADRGLPAADLLACDQHVAICPGCRAAVDAERRLLSSLRCAVTPGLPSRLESALLDLGVHAGPLAPAGGPAPLAVMNRSAPAMYRSPVRAAMLASLAAGASAAAAWSLGVSGLGATGASLPAAGPPSPAATAGSAIIGGTPDVGAVSLLNANQIAASATSVGLETLFRQPPATVPTLSPTAAGPGAGQSRLPEPSRRTAQSIHE